MWSVPRYGRRSGVEQQPVFRLTLAVSAAQIQASFGAIHAHKTVLQPLRGTSKAAAVADRRSCESSTINDRRTSETNHTYF